MAKENNKTAIVPCNESERHEQPRWASTKIPPKFKKAKKAPRYYDPKSIDEDVARLDKSQSLNGEEAARLAKAAKERGKEIGLTAGIAIAGITWLGNKLTSWGVEKVLTWCNKA